VSITINNAKQNSIFGEEMERTVLKIMLDKYYGMIEFYKESKKPDSVKLAQDEL